MMEYLDTLENIDQIVNREQNNLENIDNFRRVIWESNSLLENLETNSFREVSEETKKRIHDEMWRNLVAEYDAVHLSKRIYENTDRFSSKFLAFEKIWLLDENNHYRGLLKIYTRIFDLDESEVHQKVISRIPDFRDIESFLEDEFTLCVCFAYDELASTRGYSEAFQLYDSFRVPTVSKWIRLAARDELYHSLNAQQILKTIYYNRLENVPNVLREIVKLDHERADGYKATFLFDHESDEENNPFNLEFFKKCANDICRYLSTSLAFKEIV